MSRLNNFCIIYSDTKQKSFHHLFGKFFGKLVKCRILILERVNNSELQIFSVA